MKTLEADLVVESELADPEDTPRCCKLALSSEMISESEILVADCSTSTDELDDLTCHISDNGPCLSRFFAFLTSLGLLDSDSNFDSDSDSMTKRSIHLFLLIWSCPFLLVCPFVVEHWLRSLRTLVILFLFEGPLDF